MLKTPPQNLKLILDLCLDADFDETASDSKDVTDDEEDIPAVNKLKPVSPAHFTIQRCLKELHKLLQSKEEAKLAKFTHISRIQYGSPVSQLQLFTNWFKKNF